MAPQRSPVVTLIAAYLGLFIGLVDANAVNLALPAIGADLGGGVTGAQWTIDAYNVTFAAFLLTAGSLGDRFSRRRMLRIGLAIFVAASIACALSPSLTLLLVARAVQGLGAAMMLPQGLAIAAAVYPDPRGRARATAAWAMAAASSTALGPLLGGVLADTSGWRWIFWVNVPIGLLALVMSVSYLPDSRDPHAARLDLGGQCLAVLALGTTTLLLVEGHDWHWQQTVAIGATALAACAAFLAAQRRSPHPMLPLDVFGSRHLIGALLATFAMTFGIYGLLLVNSFAFQQLRGAGALATAVWFLPMAVVYLLLIPVANRLARRTGPRPPMAAGLTLMAAGSLLYATAGPLGAIGWLELSLVLAGAGLALNTGPAVTLAMAAIPLGRTGLAAGVVNLARLLGITVGVAVLGSAMTVVGGAAGVRTALLVGAGCQLFGAVLALRLTRRTRTPAAAAQADRTLRKESCHA
ncbi:MFS transporter [Mycolicibacterium neworleansense]|uniref:Integral membrane transport protein n=1 Tax=Mycolicibacterium neworleansense TaxID=146018 RepID=A0A0H5RN89_9MYCO|nr:MFS transporter [Mycolicibacterium neworleansense]MCV7364449.1 MFS transporter [Mycolicibacterium neworleansense]CRZ15236.1 integral membrane transport protein [Mycolicibacterium neworleansense]